MISKLYNTMLFSTVNAGKVNKHSTFSNSCLSSPSSNRNHDRFVFSEQSAHLQISGTSVQQSSRSVAQKTQARNIPSMLAAKIAGLKTNGTGSPIINSKFDYEAYNSAKLKIQNNPKKINYRKEYCYSQTGSNNYGFSSPRTACAAFSFATALSIKYNKKITPKDVLTYADGSMIENATNSDVWEWNWKDGNSTKTAYRIKASKGTETFSGIDAQLYLGNPVLIHTDGYSANGYSTQHWATIIGKENGKYQIIDPWDGTKRNLDQMEIYKNNGSVLDYVILTNEY